MNTKRNVRLNQNIQPFALREQSMLFSPLRLVAALVLCIFAVEFLVMVLLHAMPELPPLTGFLFDSFLLSAVLCPVLFLLLFRPLKHLVARYQVNADKLRSHKEQLELEVQSRTVELRESEEK